MAVYTDEEVKTRRWQAECGWGKVCTRCHEWKLLTEFSVHPLGRQGRASWCKQCHRDYGRERRAHEKKYGNLYHLANRVRRLYRIEWEEYQRALQAQNERCLGCGITVKPGQLFRADVVDGRVAGLLCERCHLIANAADWESEILTRLAEHLVLRAEPTQSKEDDDAE